MTTVDSISVGRFDQNLAAQRISPPPPQPHAHLHQGQQVANSRAIKIWGMETAALRSPR
jgi:hypothetical protein